MVYDRICFIYGFEMNWLLWEKQMDGLRNIPGHQISNLIEIIEQLPEHIIESLRKTLLSGEFRNAQTLFHQRSLNSTLASPICMKF